MSKKRLADSDYTGLPAPLIEQLERRAHDEHVSTSEVTRKALTA